MSSVSTVITSNGLDPAGRCLSVPSGDRFGGFFALDQVERQVNNLSEENLHA